MLTDDLEWSCERVAEREQALEKQFTGLTAMDDERKDVSLGICFGASLACFAVAGIILWLADWDVHKVSVGGVLILIPFAAVGAMALGVWLYCVGFSMIAKGFDHFVDSIRMLLHDYRATRPQQTQQASSGGSKAFWFTAFALTVFIGYGLLRVAAAASQLAYLLRQAK